MSRILIAVYCTVSHTQDILPSQAQPQSYAVVLYYILSGRPSAMRGIFTSLAALPQPHARYRILSGFTSDIRNRSVLYRQRSYLIHAQ